MACDLCNEHCSGSPSPLCKSANENCHRCSWAFSSITICSSPPYLHNTTRWCSGCCNGQQDDICWRDALLSDHALLDTNANTLFHWSAAAFGHHHGMKDITIMLVHSLVLLEPQSRQCEVDRMLFSCSLAIGNTSIKDICNQLFKVLAVPGLPCQNGSFHWHMSFAGDYASVSTVPLFPSLAVLFSLTGLFPEWSKLPVFRPQCHQA